MASLYIINDISSTKLGGKIEYFFWIQLKSIEMEHSKAYTYHFIKGVYEKYTAPFTPLSPQFKKSKMNPPEKAKIVPLGGWDHEEVCIQSAKAFKVQFPVIEFTLL